ncbi:MAG: tetratricopeptide repeat protein [Tannerellaceae bacterium]|jgi:tetratricopeptide (TPR) repeat protein|nr:tetratricopeptide repeat protein [Tannerellaceae bacterium]
MRPESIATLLQRYLAANKRGVEIYFDADEIDALLDAFELKEDFTHYEPLLALGLKLHPDNTELKLRKCKFHLYNEEYRQALDLLEGMPGVNSEDADLLRLECYCTLKQYEKAVSYVEELLRNHCDYIEDVFEFLVPILVDLDMRSEAKDFIERGQRFFPHNLLLKEELCYLLEAEGNYEEAIRICNELIDKVPYSYDYWYLLGRLYSQTSDYDNAIDAFDFALTCDDSDEELKVLKAYCFFMNENYEKAIEIYSELIDGELITDRVNALIAECYIRLEDFEQAYQLLKKIFDNQPQDSDLEPDETIYISFIRCCVETDREAEASQALIRAADIFPDNVRILSLLALNYLERGKESLALNITRKILRLLGTSRSKKHEEELGTLTGDDTVEFTQENLNKIIRYYKKIIHLTPHLSLHKPIPPEELAREYLKQKYNLN